MMNTRHPLAAFALSGMMVLGVAGCELYYGKGDPPIVEPPVEPPIEPPTLPPELIDTGTPPPVSGGTMLVTESDLAVVADVDHDAVWVVDLRDDTLRGSIQLEPGVELGRLVEDADGRVHTVLRQSGHVATLDVENLAISYRRSVCPAPRGLVYDARTDVLHVACVGGELVTLPATDGPIVRSITLDQDLRDVVMDGDLRMVSRFTSSEVLVVDDQGQVLHRVVPPVMEAFPGSETRFQPSVAWRARPYERTGGMALLHQRAFDGPVDPEQGYGGDGCVPGLIHSTVTVVKSDGRVFSSSPMLALLGVDMAINPDGDQGVVANAGGFRVAAGINDNWVTFFNPRVTVVDEDGDPPQDPCTSGFLDDIQSLPGPSISVAYDRRARALVQTRNPDALVIFENGAELSTINFPTQPVRNLGYDMFHGYGEAFISCASCHPEGREDGRTWFFDNLGPRRTQALRGGLLGSEPFHWGGDMENLDMLMGEVFSRRMFHRPAEPEEVESLAAWMEAMPSIPSSPVDSEAAARGKILFEDSTVGCATCHNGGLYTNNLTVDVGTGEPLQVPRLTGVWARPPFMHDGCAETLEDRFGPCGGGDLHGQTSHLSADEISDLVTYLKTL